MHILVTGGAGFIGSHTIDRLLEKGHTVRILDNLQKPVHLKGKPSYLPTEAEFIEGDVTDKPTLEKALEGIDAVYHLAAYQDYLPDFSTYFHVNAVSTALLYEIIVERKLPIQKVIVASSQAVMGEGRHVCSEHGDFFPDIRLEESLRKGEWEHRCPVCQAALSCEMSDETVINPRNQYAISKHTQEVTAINLGKRYGIPTVAMRYSIVQGPRQSFYNAYSGAMRIFALHLYFKKQPVIYEDGQQIRDYVNYQDVVKANVLVLEKEEANYRVFNVGGGKKYSVLDFYSLMQKVVGREIDPLVSSFYRYGDTRHIFSDTGALESLGWKAEFSVEDSIRAYWEYLNAQNDIEDILDYAENRMKTLDVVRSIQS